MSELSTPRPSRGARPARRTAVVAATFLLSAVAGGQTIAGGARAPNPIVGDGPTSAQGSAAGTWAFVDVTVVPMDRDRTVPAQTVVVRDGRIVAMGASVNVRVPDGAQRIDGRGKFLMPGFTEMHGHVPGQRNAFAENVLALYTLAGITTVRGMQGTPAQLEMRKAVASGELLGPTLLLAAPAMSGQNTPDPAAGAQKVRDARAAGFDLLKIHEGLSIPTYDSIATVAKSLKLPFAGHVPNDVGVKRALELGQNTIDHLDNYVESLATSEFPGSNEAEKMRAMVAATKRAGAGVVPTQALWEVILGAHDPATMTGREELRYMPRQLVTNWTNTVSNIRGQANQAQVADMVAKRNTLLKMMLDGGVPILFGTDAPQLFSVPGFSVRREMTVMAAAGMSPYEIMRSGTRAVAEFLGTPNEFGTVAVGQRADLLLLDANPLASVDNFG
jgi:imidazolonepropionase-like amidohydrolase